MIREFVPEYTRFVFVPMSPVMFRIEPPVMKKSSSFGSVRFLLFGGSGGRSMNTPYAREWTIEATDVEATLHCDWPRSRENERPNDGFCSVT